MGTLGRELVLSFPGTALPLPPVPPSFLEAGWPLLTTSSLFCSWRSVTASSYLSPARVLGMFIAECTSHCRVYVSLHLSSLEIAKGRRQKWLYPTMVEMFVSLKRFYLLSWLS